MAEPRTVARADHPISRRDIDPDALKVLYRLRQFDHVAYLVGGSVRDLLLGRRPKDFDIGTSAHPYQVKKLFRNCWIIGRRFRLAHVKFGTKVIEVATFRRQVAAGEEIVQDGVPAPDPTTPEGSPLIHHDNTFGTPEEDAFRRDFTINALFYDIATFSIIDYVGGLEDLRTGVVRSIGDPDVRVREDPVRMLRAVALASRLDFAIDPPVIDAIRLHRHEIARSSPPRLLEEYYKILRAGASEKTFRGLADVGLLEPISAELHRGATGPLWQSLAELDAYRRQFEATPDTLTNAILLGSLLVPLGIPLRASRASGRSEDGPLEVAENAVRRGPNRRGRHRLAPHAAGGRGHGLSAVEHGLQTAPDPHEPRRGPALRLGELPLARRDVERLQQILDLQRRIRDVDASPRAKRSLAHRSIFREAFTWLDIHGRAPDVVEHWRNALAEWAESDPPVAPVEPMGNEPSSFRRRRRRSRRRYRPAPQ